MTENTQDWRLFGDIEIEEAKELLSHVKDIDSYGKVAVEFNPNSGNVFLVDDDYNVWMMNDGKIEQFFSCGNCDYEGFKSDYKFDKKNGNTQECCKEVYEENGN